MGTAEPDVTDDEGVDDSANMVLGIEACMSGVLKLFMLLQMSFSGLSICRVVRQAQGELYGVYEPSSDSCMTALILVRLVVLVLRFALRYNVRYLNPCRIGSTAAFVMPS